MSLYFKDIGLYLLSIIIFIITNVFSDSSISRHATFSVVVDNKIYVLGGFSVGISSPTDALFYVDLTKDFDATKVPWVDGDKIPVRTAWGVSAVGGTNKSTIFLFGGIMTSSTSDTYNFTNLLYAYDIHKNVWYRPETTGIIPMNRRESSIVVDDKGKLYIFGGSADEFTGSPNFIIFHDIYTLNTADLTWGLVSAIDPPLPTSDHTSTLLPDGRIVIIGGRESNDTSGLIIREVDIYKIKIFNTKDLHWTIMTATGPPTIQPRWGHTAVLANNTNIIVYGGMRYPAQTTAFPELLVLDISTNPFQWSTPKFSLDNRAPPLTMHVANLIGNQMIISFGNITNNDTGPKSSSADTHILDIKDYSWKSSYSASEANLTPKPPKPPSPSASSTSSKSQPETSSSSEITVEILVIVLPILAGLIIIVVASFIIIRYRRKKNENIIEIPSEEQLLQHGILIQN